MGFAGHLIGMSLIVICSAMCIFQRFRSNPHETELYMNSETLTSEFCMYTVM